jgi:hypothetical protein
LLFEKPVIDLMKLLFGGRTPCVGKEKFNGTINKISCKKYVLLYLVLSLSSVASSISKLFSVMKRAERYATFYAERYVIIQAF